MSELDYWNGRLLKGAVSRREFMGRAAALGASSLAISTMLASADARAAETPKKGGVLRLGLGGGSTTDSIDITSYNDSVMIDTGHGLFDGIVEWGDDGRPHPDLAESFEPKNGAKDWVFNLRKGIKFSNGQEFTADDAIYSLNLHRGDTKSGGAPTFKPVTDIKKLDKYQIQISLNGPDADLPYALTDYHVHMVPDGFKDWAKPVGTGAFSLDKFDPGVRISLKKTRDYWKPDRGWLDGIEVTVINDGSARLNALISGQIDAINRVDHKAVALLSKIAEGPDRARARRLARRDGDAMRQGAVRQRGHPDGDEACDRPRADPEGAVQRLRHGWQRSSDPADRSVLQQGAAAAQIRSREGRSRVQEGGNRRSEDPAAGLRRGVQRRGRRGRAAAGERRQGRHQGRSEEGAGGRLLGQRLAQGRLRLELLGRARGGDADALGRLRRRGSLERDALEQREVREAARRRSRRDRRSQAHAPTSGRCRPC